MKQPGEELQETLTELDDRAVVDYLIKNPEFFIRNARAVEAIRVPHPVRGTVSLVEWHMARARNHIHVLEENMALGVVLFTSRDASHYQQGQGTQLLHEIALMLPELLARWIERV